jgi:hypothetical protein
MSCVRQASVPHRTSAQANFCCARRSARQKLPIMEPLLTNTANASKFDKRVHETGADSSVGETVIAGGVHLGCKVLRLARLRTLTIHDRWHTFIGHVEADGRHCGPATIPPRAAPAPPSAARPGWTGAAAPPPVCTWAEVRTAAGHTNIAVASISCMGSADRRWVRPEIGRHEAYLGHRRCPHRQQVEVGPPFCP